MKIYKTQTEVESDVKNGFLVVNDDVKFEFDLKIKVSLKIKGNIKAMDIKAMDIKAWDIEADNISAWDIEAMDIKADNITAKDISFYAICYTYSKLSCKSIKGRRVNAKYFCLDNKVVIKSEVK